MKKIKSVLFSIEISKTVYSVLFAIMCVCSRHIVNEPSDRSTILTTYITPIVWYDAVLLILFTILAYVVIKALDVVVKRLAATCLTDKTMRLPGWGMWIIVFAAIMIAWIPYMMSYWPGGIYNDTLDSIHIALGKAEWSNQNTVLYALWWRLIFFIGQIANQGEYGGLKLMTILQPMIMAGVAASFFTWLRKRGVRTAIVVIGVAAFTLFPVFPYYAVSMWKDTLFSVSMFVYSWVIYMIIDEVSHSEKLSATSMVKYSLSSLLVIFGRNNGLYVYLITSILLVLLMTKKLGKRDIVRMMACVVTIAAASIIVSGPVYTVCGVEKSAPVEKYGIPLQQVGYIVSMGGNIDTESQSVFEEILPMDGWINLYSPTVVDTIKFDPLFCRGYFDTHTGDFVKAYIHTTFMNPVLSVKGYLLATIGFWDAWKSSSSAYICTAHCWNAEYFMSDYFNLKTGIYLAEIVGPRWYISSGLLIWVMLLAFVVAISSADKRYVAVEVPTLVLWLTIMLATPLAFSFRYVFSLLLCIPLYLLSAIKGLKNE